MKNNYLIRLDDACPYMDVRKWQRVENLLDKYGVKPLVGIIPANADSATMMDEEDPLFWDKVHHWIEKGWEMAVLVTMYLVFMKKYYYLHVMNH